ncbi:MAG: hypothetical protein PUC76_01245 [Clostridia bacterium]|nr:hypothetical protein [Clostridia bacterium]
MNKVQKGRAGWKQEEEELLFKEIESSESSGRPLKKVFEAVAEKTGRKPNSIRNFYYARIKEKDLSTTALHAGAFVPFSEEEIHSLLRTVLSAQANGISVRSCTMSMGGGDNKTMLRYQNKYRALLKNRPKLVEQVAAELKEEGVDFDPYMRKPLRRERNAGRLDKIEGIDGDSFMDGLERLITAASEASRKEAASKAVIAELRAKIQRQEKELMEQQSRFHELLLMYRRLSGSGREQGGEYGKLDEHSLN